MHDKVWISQQTLELLSSLEKKMFKILGGNEAIFILQKIN